MPEAVIFVAPVIAPVFVIPPELLFIPPFIEAPPLETVNAPADVIVPVPVVAIFPDVEIVPSSEIVNAETLAVCISKAIPPVPALVSLITNACALPSFVRVNCVESPVPSVKSIFLPAVVTIVLP